MRPLRCFATIALIALAVGPGRVWAQVVSPFAGSELVGTYESNFVRLHYLVPADNGFNTAAAEGQLISRIYRRPQGTSNLELYRSFETALEDAGFEIVTTSDNRSRVEILLREVNGPNSNAFIDRPYVSPGGSAVGVGTRAQVATQAQEYIAARKQVEDSELLVVVNTSRADAYLIEELRSAAMAEGSVTLTLDALRDAMATEGRIAIYGLYFDTGSATLKPESEDAVATIVDYLTENPSRQFYVVGHTDDEGNFDSNMRLSSARAESVIAAITGRLPQAGQQLSSYGVGPLSPVATNDDGEGRTLNRRVELVSRIAN